MNFTIKSHQKADKNIKNIRECLIGLYQVLKIICPSDKEILYKIAMDNIIKLNENFNQLMLNESGTSQFLTKLLKSEIDLQLPI